MMSFLELDIYILISCTSILMYTPSLRHALGLQVVLEEHPSLYTLSSSRLSATFSSILFDFIFVGTTKIF